MFLLIVEVHKAMINEKLYKFEAFVENVFKHTDTTRNNYFEVIFVRHGDGFKSELTRSKIRSEIYERFKPFIGGKVFDTYEKCFYAYRFNKYL